jgi:uncharacterized protein (TIGR03118 family)
MRRYTLVPLALALASASCTFSDIEDGLDAVFGNTSHKDNRPGQSVPISQVVRQKNLVSDLPDVAQKQDPNLVNAWGLSFNPAGPAWVSAAETGVSEVYDANGSLLLTVTVPPPLEGTSPSAPTGQVFNPDVSAFAGDRFIFVTEDGTISGWQPGFEGNNAMLRVDNSATKAVYKGVALARTGKNERIYAADFHNGKVDVYDCDYKPVASCVGGFADPKLPPNYAPFNIFAAQDMLFVSFAVQELPDKEDDDPGAGHGLIDLFDLDGNFLQRLITGGVLNSPWGMALTPGSFGRIPGRLLVGNFGDGHISTFRFDLDGFKLAPVFEGFLGDFNGRPITIDGLWAIAFPPNAGGFDSQDLYFTAGPEDESHGLFGRLELPDSHGGSGSKPY